MSDTLRARLYVILTALICATLVLGFWFHNSHEAPAARVEASQLAKTVNVPAAPVTQKPEQAKPSKHEPVSLESTRTGDYDQYVLALNPIVRGIQPAEDDMKAAIAEYASDHQVLYNEKWRGSIGIATGKILEIGLDAQHLPSAPPGLEKADTLLRKAGKAYELMADALATFVIQKDDDWLGKAADRRDEAHQIMEDATQALHEYNETNGK